MNFQEQIRLLQEENESLKRRFEQLTLTGNEIGILQIIVRYFFDTPKCSEEQAEILRSLIKKLGLPQHYIQEFESDLDFEFNM